MKITILRKAFSVFIRLKDVFFMFLMLLIFPKLVHKFSTRKFLYPNSYCYSVNEKPKLPFKLIKNKKKIKKYDEINLIAANKDINLQMLKNVKIPTFLNYFWQTIKISSEGNLFYSGKGHLSYTYNNFEKVIKKKRLKEYKNQNIIYVHSYEKTLIKFSNKGHNVLFIDPYIKISKNLYKSESNFLKKKNFQKILKKKKFSTICVGQNYLKDKHPDNYYKGVQFGSFLTTIGALSFIAKKINIYGWDYYFRSSVKNMGFFNFLKNMYNYELDKRSKNHFETGLFQLYYASVLSKNPRFKISGKLVGIQKHKFILKKIEKAIFNN